MIGTVSAVVLDTTGHRALAAFYRDLTGWAPAGDTATRTALHAPDGWTVAFRSVDAARPHRGHLDIRVPELEPALERAVALGGTPVRRFERWITVADPAGNPFDLNWQPNLTHYDLLGPVLDCPDPWRLSVFYTGLLGKPLTYNGDDGFAMIGETGAQPITFQRSATYHPHPGQLHLEIAVDDLAAAAAAAESLGATQDAGRWLDPTGRPFTLRG
ncbi:VOC family protein [Dactylosporangium vinaceum]|uniref:VOC family protein n=1 Tax=Dactylosporangium vinaceum TaxID=53362 RepID=A0ABV5MIY0_9ACTN|nr:VOC family protein [Dactylosporangium vinaceum]UAB93731.1 VOC family protein [Dactylosporangium vinaceum]